jgi:UDPglucose 6-dehydrogenase
LTERASVSAYDPVVKEIPLPGIRLGETVAEMAGGADAFVLVTEWEEFRDLPWAALAATMRRPVLIDGRNLLSPVVLAEAGFTYRAIGR